MDGAHGPDSTDIVGYSVCSRFTCGNWVLDLVARHTKGLCERCVAGGHLPTFRDVSIQEAGARHSYKPNRKGGPRGHVDPERVRAAGRARGRALRRLKNLFPELFDLVYAEERATEGLEPFPLEKAASTVASDTEAWKMLVDRYGAA